MFGAANLIEWIGQNLAELLPFAVIPEYSRGVRFFLGRVFDRSGHPWTGTLGPGLWLRIPWLWNIETLHVVPTVVNLPTQTITTKDGHALSFSANVVFEIVDATRAWTRVQAVSDSVAFLCMSHLARRLRNCTMDEAVSGGRRLEVRLQRSLTHRLGEWGVRVTDVGLTDMVRSRALRLYGDPATLRG